MFLFFFYHHATIYRQSLVFVMSVQAKTIDVDANLKTINVDANLKTINVGIRQ